VDIYNIKTNAWSTTNITGIGPRNCITAGSKVFLAYGETDVVDIYDDASKSWSSTKLRAFSSSMPPESVLCAVDEVVLFAGDVLVVDICNYKNNTCNITEVSRNNYVRNRFSAGVLDERYCLFGGGLLQTNYQPLTRVDIYDSKTKVDDEPTQ
jgi:hypothetical protein